MRIFQINQKIKRRPRDAHALNLAPDSGNSKRPTARSRIEKHRKAKTPFPHHSTSRADISAAIRLYRQSLPIQHFYAGIRA